MGVFAKVNELLGGGLSFEEALKKASEGAQKEQETKFRDPKTLKKWGFGGKTPEEQRELDEQSAQGDPESKG